MASAVSLDNMESKRTKGMYTVALLNCFHDSNTTILYMASQHTLRTPHLPFPSLDPRTRHPTCPCQRLERTLRPMMIVASPNHVHV